MQNQDQQELPTILEQALYQLSVERAAGRIREEVLAMRSTDDLLKVVVALYLELKGFDTTMISCSIHFIDEEADFFVCYSTTENIEKYGVPPQTHVRQAAGGDISAGISLFSISEMLDLEIMEAWRAQKEYSYVETPENVPYIAEMLKEYPGLKDHPHFGADGTVTHVPFPHGTVALKTPTYSDADIAVAQVFTETLSLGFLRFLDFQRLEEQNRRLSLDAAVERVRAEAMAMRGAEDLHNVVTVMFQELVGLGVETVQCNLSFFDEEMGLIRNYTAMEDPGKYGSSWMPPNGRELAPGVVGGYAEEPLDIWPSKVLEDWRAGKATSDTRIAEENEFVMGLRAENSDLENYPPFTGEWVIHNIPFTHGIIGFSEKEHREEHIALVQTLVEALSLGYVRFLDFHAVEEARQKLIDELEEELQTAHDMQMRLMPVESPQIPDLDIAGRCLTANHVGGDLFQYFRKDDSFVIALADITGHAMEAAIPAVMFSGVLETEMQHDSDLETLFTNLNRNLCKQLDDRTFVCFTMGELDRSTHILRLANGGCPYPYRYKASTGEIAEIQVEAYPLGIRPDTSYPSSEVQLEPGDRILLCSDGIVEAANAEDELFGFERTAATIRQGCADNFSSEDLLQHLLAKVEQFTGDVPRADDQTVVVLALKS